MSTKPVIKKLYCCGELYECPHWSTEENALYWVDVVGQEVFRLEPKTGIITSREIGYGQPSVIITIQGILNWVLVAIRSGIYLLPWDSPKNDTSLKQLTQVDLRQPDNRVNDGKVDAKGRLWFGTIGKVIGLTTVPDKGSVYMIDSNNYANPALMVRPVSLSNGIAWSPNYDFMYYIDSPTRRVDLFDFDLETGKISNRRPLFNFDDYDLSGIPDGMTIDSDGNLWVACFQGGKVIKIDSKYGELLDQYKMPVDEITSVMWGGCDLSTLYVTSGRLGLNATELDKQPDAGSLFSIEGTGSKGIRENQFIFRNASKCELFNI